MNKAHKIAFREALRNDVPFSYFAPHDRKVIRHNSAIVEAIASRRQFSYADTKAHIKFN
jgi:hypothetical protein